MEVSGKRIEPIDGNVSIKMDTLCVFCKEENMSTQANGFCKECGGIMCHACFRKHLRLKACQNHTFLDTIAPSETLIKNNVEESKCKQHRGEIVKYYCRKHEAVGCGDCMICNHMACKPEFIKDLSANFQENEDFKTLMAHIEKLISESKECLMDIEENKKDNKTMLEKSLGDIKQFRLDINKYLDKVEKDITCQIENVKEENESLLTKLENDCSIILVKLEEITQMLNFELYKDDILFVEAVECKRKVSESERAISGMKSKSMKKYEFVSDEQIRSLVSSTHKLGKMAISSSGVCHRTAEKSHEKCSSTVSAGDNAEDTLERQHDKTEDVEGGFKHEKAGERSAIIDGPRVQKNSWSLNPWGRLAGTVTIVHENGEVTVEWDGGGFERCKVGQGRGDVTIIKS